MLTEAAVQGFSVKKVFLEIFAKCTGKHPCQSLFNKVAGLSVHKYYFCKINTYCINVNNFPHMILSFRVQDKMCGFDMSARHNIFLWDNVPCPTAISILSNKLTLNPKRWFCLRCFRNYIAGAPWVEVRTGHKPLCPIFIINRKGSKRNKIKLQHQDIT